MGVAEVHRGCVAHQLQALVELGHDRTTRYVGAVEVERDVAQPLAREPIKDHVECGALLRDEQDSLPSGHQTRHEIGDGLRLPRSRRTLNDSRTAAQHAFDDVLLARIGREDEKFQVRRPLVERAEVARAPFAGGVELVANAREARNRRDDVVPSQHGRVVTKVVDHRHLLEGEISHDEPSGDREAWCLRLHHQGIEWTFWSEGRRCAGARIGAVEQRKEVRLRQRAAELGLKDVEKHGVDDGIAGSAKLEGVASARLELQGNQNDRGRGRAAAVEFRPGRESDAQKERRQTSLLRVFLRPAPYLFHARERRARILAVAGDLRRRQRSTGHEIRCNPHPSRREVHRSGRQITEIEEVVPARKVRQSRDPALPRTLDEFHAPRIDAFRHGVSFTSRSRPWEASATNDAHVQEVSVVRRRVGAWVSG